MSEKRGGLPLSHVDGVRLHNKKELLKICNGPHAFTELTQRRINHSTL